MREYSALCTHISQTAGGGCSVDLLVSKGKNLSSLHHIERFLMRKQRLSFFAKKNSSIPSCTCIHYMDTLGFNMGTCPSVIRPTLRCADICLRKKGSTQVRWLQVNSLPIYSDITLIIILTKKTQDNFLLTHMCLKKYMCGVCMPVSKYRDSTKELLLCETTIHI